MKMPGAVARGVRAAAVVVVGETGANVRGETDVVVVSWIGSLQNIDKSLVFEHPKAKATAVPSVDVSKFTGLALWLRDVRSFYDSRPDGNGARFA